ncbi:MAG: hypothetical protein JO336_11450 [Acidobacteriia bacterium]|nr:hypothetical protein [Terriglobia bacterium]MBV8905116.1 hypothetical protein [Terriglobia bacterium]MBV9745405.1 hypothetical protein [Terriglobia bacterium]
MTEGGHKPLPERLPKPSFAPPTLAAGLLLLLWGVVTSWIISALGLAIAAFAISLWIRDARDKTAKPG